MLFLMLEKAADRCREMSSGQGKEQHREISDKEMFAQLGIPVRKA